MKRNWIKWIALGLTVGMLGIMVPAVAHAEEATDSVITEEVQEPVTEEEVTPDVPSDDPKITESVPEAPVEDDAESAEDAAVLENDVLVDTEAGDRQMDVGGSVLQMVPMHLMISILSTG